MSSTVLQDSGMPPSAPWRQPPSMCSTGAVRKGRELSIAACWEQLASRDAKNKQVLPTFWDHVLRVQRVLEIEAKKDALGPRDVSRRGVDTIRLICEGSTSLSTLGSTCELVLCSTYELQGMRDSLDIDGAEELFRKTVDSLAFLYPVGVCRGESSLPRRRVHKSARDLAVASGISRPYLASGSGVSVWTTETWRP